MGAVASITIVVDEKGAVTAINNVGGAVDKLPGAFGRAGKSGNVVLTQMNKDHERARQSAQLLANTMGIAVPRALESILAKTPGVSQALNAAFAATVIVTFAKEVLALVDNLTGYSEQLGKIQAQNDALISSVAAANKTLLGPQSLKQVQADILRTTKYVSDLEQQLGLTGDAFDPLTRGLAKYNQEQRVQVEELDKAKARLNDLGAEQAKLTDEQRRTDPVERLKLQNQARLAGLEGIGAIRAAEKAADAEIIANAKAVAENDAITQAKIAANHAESRAKRIAYERSVNDETRHLAEQAIESDFKGTEAIRVNEQHQVEELKILLDRRLIDQQTFNERRRSLELIAENQIKEIHRQAAEDTLKIEEDAAVALLPPWQRSYAQIARDTQDRLREIQRALDETRISSDEAARQSAAAWQLNFARVRDQLAGDLESLFDDVTSGNIGKRFLDMFKHMVFQMIATWILGMSSMRKASAGAFGGGGGILGAIFGGGGLFGGGGGPGGTPPFVGEAGGLGGFGGGGNAFDPFSAPGNANGAFGLLGLGLSAGQGAGTPGGVLPSGASAAGRGGFSLAGLLTSGGFKQLALTGGLALLTSSFGKGGAGGILGSAAGGALIGSIIPGVGTLIGAAVGALVGLFSSLFGEHKGDKARKQVMEPLTQQIKLVRDSYDVFQTDYNSATSELEQLRADALSKLKSIGGKQVKGNSSMVGVMINEAETYLKNTEAERHRRSVIPFGPAQFHLGGMVREGPAPNPFAPKFHMGGEVAATLLQGEGVVNQWGMRRLGEDGLQRINSGGSAGERHIHVHAVDPRSFAQWLRGGGLAVIADEWDRAEMHGGV
jgi:gas vesicle protein